MVGLSEKTLLAFSIAFSAFAPQSTPSAAPDDLLIPREYVYMVKEGDSLSSIAENKYGDKAYWTTIWNDNDNLNDPNLIHSELKLKIRIEKPFKIDAPKRGLSSDKASTTIESVYHKLTYDTQKRVVSWEEVQQVQTPTQQINPSPFSEEQLTFLGNCEAGMDPTKNTGNGYYGAFQFADGTWDNLQTGYERADLAPLEVQKEAVQHLLVRSSIFTQFPACSRKMQASGLI